MISSYGDQNRHQGIILHIIIVLRNAASIALNALETPYVLYMQLQHPRDYLINGAIKHIFYTNPDPRRDHQQVFFIHFVATCICYLAVQILLQIFLYEDLKR